MTSRPMLLVLAAAMAGCQSPQSRIKKNQAAFDAYPPAVQSAVQEGRVGVGFTPEQVLMALGKPDRVDTKKTAAAARETWAYGVSGRSDVGFGLGMSSMNMGGGGRTFGSRVGVSSPLRGREARLRITFEDGKVVVIDHRGK